MEIQGFTADDFAVFSIDGLNARMEALQTNIQPKFKSLGDILTSDLSMMLGNEMHLHIAKHARRTVNPPNDSWLAICHNKRGYKKYPHFQLGLFDDRLFLWLALIYELPNKSAIASSFLEKKESLFPSLPNDFVLSLDHFKKDAENIHALTNEDLTKRLERFQNVKKAEFLIGRHFMYDDPIIQNRDSLLQVAMETFTELMPLYKQAMTI